MRSALVLDGDGVLLDFETAFCSWIERKYGAPLSMVSSKYDLTERYGLEMDFWPELKQDDELWANVPLYPDAKELIYALEDMGYEVWLGTAIGANQHDSRAASMLGLIPKGRIVCAGWAASSAQKAEILKSVGAVGFLDDNWHHVLAADHLPTMRCARYLHHADYDNGVVPESLGVVDDLMDFAATLETMRNNAQLAFC